MIGSIIADIQGLELSSEDEQLLQHPLIGGVVLFTRNYHNAEQLTYLVQALKSLKRETPLLISVDHEGGRVQRFRPGFTEIPSMAALGHLYDQSHEAGLKAAFLVGWLLAAELRRYQIDYSYTPVLDINYHLSSVIGDRAFHANPDAILSLSHALISGLHDAGMIAIGKHFPGHGGVGADSHIAIPVDERELEVLWSEDMLPYKHLIEHHYLTGIMTAHVIYEKVDPAPPCFSSFWLQRILREELAFRGAIISDDLCMKGAETAGNYAERAEKALAAGCDLLLICNNRNAVLEALAHIAKFYEPNPLSQLRGQALFAQALPPDFMQHSNWEAAMTVVNELKKSK